MVIKGSFVDPINQVINLSPASSDQTRETSVHSKRFFSEEKKFWQWIKAAKGKEISISHDCKEVWFVYSDPYPDYKCTHLKTTFQVLLPFLTFNAIKFARFHENFFVPHYWTFDLRHMLDISKNINPRSLLLNILNSSNSYSLLRELK